jgi:endonuclease G
MTERQQKATGWVYFCIYLMILLAISGAANAATTIIGDVALNRNRHLVFGVPGGNDRSTVVVSRAQYALSWDFDRRGPAWVALELTKKQLGMVKRSNVFRVDHDLEDYLNKINKSSVKPDEYKGSCLDRGHQVASADRTALLPDNQATFLMSNMVPQSAYLNRVAWASLETFLRDLVLDQRKELNIYSGTIYETDEDIGANRDIRVPTKNFKVVVIKPAVANPAIKDMRLMVVDLPNVTSTGTDPVLDNYQACQDSAHTARLDEKSTKAYWRKYLSDLNTVQSEAYLNMMFLSKIPKLSKAELDVLLQAQFKNQARYLNLMGVMADALETAVAVD